MMSPFDLPGGQFLALYAALFVLAVIAGFAIPRLMRPDGRTVAPRDPDELAYLAGGAQRFADTVISRLLGQGDVVMTGSKLAIQRDGKGRGEPDRSVLALKSPAPVSKAIAVIARHAGVIDERLVRAGMMMEPGAARRIGYFAAAPFLALILFGSIKYQVGVARERPVGFLTVFLIVTLIAAIIRFVSVDRRTRGALAVLAETRGRSSRLQRAPTAAEMPMAVALFGTAVLAGSEFDTYHQARAASSGGDAGSTSGSSGSSGSDGGGGGGCGGCGS